jgi:pimeloyl-ACP methyl ester carboxylesterase
MTHPDRVDRLVILNLPHPRGLMRELANNPEQQKNSQYARDFQKPEAAKAFPVEALAGWVKDEADRARYVEALKRSSLEGMLNYYKANYPRPPYKDDPDSPMPRVKCPVLIIHGLKDIYLLHGALNDTWTWVDNVLTLVTIPDAGHFVQHDAPEVVTRTMVKWLTP